MFPSGIFDTIPRTCVVGHACCFNYLLAKKSVQMPRWLAPRSAVDYSSWMPDAEASHLSELSDVEYFFLHDRFATCSLGARACDDGCLSAYPMLAKC